MCTNELECGNKIIQIDQILICCDNEAVKSYENLNPINIYGHISGCNTDMKGVFMSQISKSSTWILGPQLLSLLIHILSTTQIQILELYSIFFQKL